MNSLIIFQQLLVLLGMMLSGYIAFKANIIDEHSYNKVSSLVVKILNPFLMISGVVEQTTTFDKSIIRQNIILVFLYYLILFLAGFVYTKAMKHPENESCLYRMLILLPNVGFMGIPIIKESLGADYIVLVAFYILGFNLLAYTYGVRLSCKFGNRVTKTNLKDLVNPGMVCAILAIAIFYLHIQLPRPIVSFFNYMSGACIVMSMIVIGAFLARMDLKKALFNSENLIFVMFVMLLLPCLMVFASKILGYAPSVLTVFSVMACMPVGSMTCMLAQEYGGDGTKAAQLIAVTTLSTVITAPAVFYLSNIV